MGGGPAVGVHNDLAAGEAGVALGTADDEAAGGVDIDLGVLVHEPGGDGGLDDQGDHILPNLLQLHVGAGLVVLVIFHGDLGLAVGTEVVHLSLLADLGQALGHLMGQGNGQRHELRGLVAGVAEHHALVAGAVVQLGVAALLGLQRLVHAQGDVGALLVDVGDDAAGVAVEAVLGPVIADLPDNVPGHLGDVHVAVGADLAHDMDEARGSGGLAGHAAQGVLL